MKHGSSALQTGVKLSDLIKRTELDYDKTAEIDENRPELSKQVRIEVNIQVKYEGYINMEEKQVEKFKKLETKKAFRRYKL